MEVKMGKDIRENLSPEAVNIAYLYDKMSLSGRNTVENVIKIYYKMRKKSHTKTAADILKNIGTVDFDADPFLTKYFSSEVDK